MISVEDLPLLSELLEAIRRSLEGRLGLPAANLTQVTHTQYVQFETVRAEYFAAMNRSRHSDSQDLNRLLQTAGDGLWELMKDNDFLDRISRIKLEWRKRLRSMQVRSPFGAGLVRLTSGTSVFDAISYLASELREGIAEPELALVTSPIVGADVQALRKAVPAQKLAPVSFDIVDGKLIVSKQEASPLVEDAPIAAQAKEQLLDRGKHLLDELHRSNCDRRLVAELERLQEQLSSPRSVIELALTNVAFGAMAKSYEAELPAGVSALMQVHTAGVSMYVAQFPDWQRFTENAASVELDNTDIEAISAKLTEVIEATKKDTRIADPDVPRTLHYLSDLVHQPGKTSKRAAMAVVRTLENMVIRLFRFGADVFEQTLTKSTGSISTALARGLAVALLTLGLSAASSLTGLSSKIGGMNWIEDAASIVSKGLRSIKDE
ncbi:hypothetical protein [Mesorhizobium sp.]|uniref:hypothetical protein n=1 Tax=Mesorhizobium sp. TaxID=1871066 RepID=UPI0012231D85|nr:hypothetical protein [Mesorhizobium sp.]TIL49671.1 MAG: hypothetical protein E5Y83_25245 [Mesorhizobium sp.]